MKIPFSKIKPIIFHAMQIGKHAKHQDTRGFLDYASRNVEHLEEEALVVDAISMDDITIHLEAVLLRALQLGRIVNKFRRTNGLPAIDWYKEAIEMDRMENQDES